MLRFRKQASLMAGSVSLSLHAVLGTSLLLTAGVAYGQPCPVGDDGNSYSEDSAVILYQNDFEDALDPLLEWSSRPTDITPGTPQHSPDRFLGRFAGNDSTTLTLTDLPAHDTMTIILDLYILQTWDGNNNPGPDIWDLTVDGSTILEHTTFTNYEEPENTRFRQAYPDSYPGGDHAARTCAAENNTLGYGSNTGTQFKDAVYRLSYTFAHLSPTLELTCSGSGLQTLNDESWGLDNLAVFTPQDTDGDGLPDEEDACPESDLSGTVVIDGCGSGAENLLFDDGCSMADMILECPEGARNHGSFVRCVAHLTNSWKHEGIITEREKGRIQRCAAGVFLPGRRLAAE